MAFKTPGGQEPPILLFSGMIDRTKIEKLVNSYIAGKDIFPVDVKITRDNRITVLVDTPAGITLEQCAELNRFIEKNLSRNEEDYDLQVSSPGIGHPFTVKEQYVKNTGKMIEVVNLKGEKQRGILKKVTESGFELECVPKKKSKSVPEAAEIKIISFNFDEVKSAKEYFVFR